MPKQLVFNTPKSTEARDKINSGISKLAEAVKITLGPSGRVVMFEREFGDPVITKDGVTVAKEVELEDRLENMAASMVRQATAKTAAVAGDGTTTATIYVQAIYESGIKGTASGANPQEVKRGIDYAAKTIVGKLQEASKPVVDLEQIQQVAICSSNQDIEVGSMITEALRQVGKDGVVTIEEGNALETTVSVVDGLQFPRGYVSPQFATDPETLACEYDDPNIVIVSDKLTDLKSVLKLLEVTVREGSPVVVIADEFSDDVIAAMVLNRIRSQLNIVAVKAPGFGDRRVQVLEDLAIATGGTILSKGGIDPSQIKSSHFGKCKRIKIDRDSTTILEGKGDPDQIEARIELLRSQLEKVPGSFDKERVQERLARLTGGVAQISVGGATEVEVREKKDRIDDALHACKAAIEEGILPGGGVAAVHAAKNDIERSGFCDDFKIGIDILLRALEAPLRQIAINTGEDDGVVANKVKESNDSNYGFDAANKKYGNMVEFGIIVPTKVERVALLNAASVAGLLLTTDCMISIIKDGNEQQPQSPFPSLGM